jgi:hypothetical protein
VGQVEAPKVVFSSLNLVKTPYMWRPVSWLGKFAKNAGLDGVEYAPVLDLMPGHTVQAVGKAVMRGQLELNSVHATYRLDQQLRTSNLPGAPRPPLADRFLNGRAGRLLMPDSYEAAEVLNRIQWAAGKLVSAVLYPQKDPVRDNHQIWLANGRSALLQPTDHNARLVGAPTLEEYDNLMRNTRDYDGYVLDTTHVYRRYGESEPGILSNIEASVPYLGPYIHAVHLSVGRDDLPPEPHIDSRRDLRDALEGDYSRSATGALFDMLKEAGSPIGYIAIEAPLTAVMDETGHTKVGDLQQDYAAIAQGVRAYWLAA